MEVFAHNINTWDGHMPAPPIVQAGILPDPATGSLRHSGVPMQDDPDVYESFAAAPYVAPQLDTLGNLIGDHCVHLASDTHGAALAGLQLIV